MSLCNVIEVFFFALRPFVAVDGKPRGRASSLTSNCISMYLLLVSSVFTVPVSSHNAGAARKAASL